MGACDSRIRKEGGGRKRMLPKHPEWAQAIMQIIELFSQITRSWSGAPLMNLQNAVDRAAMTTTKTGLKVYAHVNSNNYDIKRPIDESYQKNLDAQVVFAPKLGKWNYLVKPVN